MPVSAPGEHLVTRNRTLLYVQLALDCLPPEAYVEENDDLL